MSEMRREAHDVAAIDAEVRDALTELGSVKEDAAT
jgi:hypothetical protein